MTTAATTTSGRRGCSIAVAAAIASWWRAEDSSDGNNQKKTHVTRKAQQQRHRLRTSGSFLLFHRRPLLSPLPGSEGLWDLLKLQVRADEPTALLRSIDLRLATQVTCNHYKVELPTRLSSIRCAPEHVKL